MRGPRWRGGATVTLSSRPADRADLSWLEAILGDRVVAVVELTAPWATRTRTYVVSLGLGDRVVLQRMGDRRAMGRRIRLGRLLPVVAPWVPVPAVLAGDASAAAPFAVTRFVPGVPARELLADDAGAELLGREMGKLARDLARVPTRSLRLPGLWGDPDRLASAARRWLDEVTPEIGPSARVMLGRLLDRLPDELGGTTPVFAHGDFAPVNVILRDGHAVALLDLERARLADPLFDAAWWRWILRHHHPERRSVAGPAFLTAAGIDDGPRTTARLDLLAALQLLEMLHGSPARPPASRRAWKARLLGVLAWTG